MFQVSPGSHVSGLRPRNDQRIGRYRLHAIIATFRCMLLFRALTSSSFAKHWHKQCSLPIASLGECIMIMCITSASVTTEGRVKHAVLGICISGNLNNRRYLRLWRDCGRRRRYRENIIRVIPDCIYRPADCWAGSGQSNNTLVAQAACVNICERISPVTTAVRDASLNNLIMCCRAVS
jgi:hypothetical protein